MANEVKAMGSRLGVIVKTIDGWDIRYDHWSAQTLGRDIALDGYEATLTRIRQMAPYGVDTPQEMKSAPWLEGTLFIDMTTKRIVWAEESEGCYLPRLINALIELTWPGWTAIWSPEGTRGTLRATGADTDIQSIEDLQGKTVSIGAEESGSEQNALQILSAYGLNDRLVDTINLNYTDAADQLKAGKIDAIVITVGTPSPVVTELAGECGIRLLNVDGTAAQRLLSSYNAYREVTIPAGTYPGQNADVQTVGVKAVLLASDSLPAKQVQQLTELLFSSREALEEQLGLALDPETDAVEGVGIPFHAGAAAWYKQAGITVD